MLGAKNIGVEIIWETGIELRVDRFRTDTVKNSKYTVTMNK